MHPKGRLLSLAIEYLLAAYVSYLQPYVDLKTGRYLHDTPVTYQERIHRLGTLMGVPSLRSDPAVKALAEYVDST